MNMDHMMALRGMIWTSWRRSHYCFVDHGDRWESGKRWELVDLDHTQPGGPAAGILCEAPFDSRTDHAKVVLPRVLDEWFSWKLTVGGQIKALQLQAANGMDRLVRADPAEMGISLENPQQFHIYRDGPGQSIVFQWLDEQGNKRDMPTRSFGLSKSTGGFFPSIAVFNGGSVLIKDWELEGVKGIFQPEDLCPKCGVELEFDTDAEDTIYNCGVCGLAWRAP
jgi:ribosomal protein S27AE